MKSLGPKITMIGKMMKQLAFFMPIILLYMFTYSIVSHALQFHNSVPSIELLKDIFFPGYFILGGEHYKLADMRDATSNQCYQNYTSLADFSTDQTCPEPNGAQVSLALYVFYLLFMLILIQNLLIAIFSDIYEAIDKESDKVWKYQRYSLSYEYFHKPFAPSPLVLFYYIFYLLKALAKLAGHVCPSFDNKFYAPGFYYEPKNSDERKDFVKLELYHSNVLLLNLKVAEQNMAESKIARNAELMDHVYRTFNGIREARDDILNQLSQIDFKFKLILKSLDRGSHVTEVKNIDVQKKSERSLKNQESVASVKESDKQSI